MDSAANAPLRALHVPQGLSDSVYRGGMSSRRYFGKLRRLPSGRWQASYVDPASGQRITAPATFVAKADANVWLSGVESDLARGEQLDLRAATTPLSEYATVWLAGKEASLRLRTVELYSYLLRVHVSPTLGSRPVASLTAPEIRSWHGTLISRGLSQATVAKAYRLLRQIMDSAVDDRLRRDNPCRIKGASVERSRERQIPSPEQVVALADAIAPHYRAMVILAAFAGLRKGECLGLTRSHLDLDNDPPTVTIDRALVGTHAGYQVVQEPKTDAGYRTLALSPSVVRVLEGHLAEFVEPDAGALLFTDARTGNSPTKDRFRWEWQLARRATGLDHTFHDLRHLAGTLNAIAGATTKEAMARLGHTSPQAALRYQHAVASRDAEIAQAVEDLLPPISGD